MPLYDFACVKCGEKFEEIVANSQVEAVKCPKCESPAKKLMGGIGGYKIRGNNSGSVTPRGSGSRK